jgi:capsular polysaccharide biosynthesis protein cpsC
MEELDLGQIISLFWHRKVQIVLIILIFIVIGIGYTIGFVTPKYTSSTTLVLAAGKDSTLPTSITATDVNLNSKLISTYREIATSDKVVRKVINNLGLDISDQGLKNSITVKVVSDSEVIKISVTNTDPEKAAKIANEVANVFTEQVKEIYNIDNVHVVDTAEQSDTPSNINHTKDVLIFAFIGIVVSIIYVLIDNMLDTTIKEPEDIEKTCGVTLLASIPFDNSESKKGGRK